MSKPRDPPEPVLSIENEQEPAPSMQSEELQQKRTHYRRLVDLALGEMSIDDIRELVRQMEDELRQ